MFRCEEPVDLDVVIPENVLVVTSVLFPDDLAEVNVSSSNEYFNNGEKFPFDDATVEIFGVGNGNSPVARLNYVEESNGRYLADDFYPRSGITYRVRVYADDYGLAFAESYVPHPSRITDLTYRNLVINEYEDEKVYNFELGIKYEDPPNELNYYHMRFFQLRNEFAVNSDGDMIIINRSSAEMEFPPAPDGEYRHAGNKNGILFTETPFGDEFFFSLSSSIDPSKEILGQMYTELRTVSREYYNHQISIANSSVNHSGSLTQSGSGYGNVKNGAGTVTGYAGSSDTIIIN